MLGLERQHRVLEELLARHQVALIERRSADATRLFGEYAAGLTRHIEFEERHLLPRCDLLEGPRWSDTVYRAEHRRIEGLMLGTAERLRRAGPAQISSLMLIALLDAERTFKHPVEHHHTREEQALFAELRHARAPIRAVRAERTASGTDS